MEEACKISFQVLYTKSVSNGMNTIYNWYLSLSLSFWIQNSFPVFVHKGKPHNILEQVQNQKVPDKCSTLFIYTEYNIFLQQLFWSFLFVVAKAGRERIKMVGCV